MCDLNTETKLLIEVLKWQQLAFKYKSTYYNESASGMYKHNIFHGAEILKYINNHYMLHVCTVLAKHKLSTKKNFKCVL